MRHVVIADLDIDPERFDRFVELMLVNARNSRLEPGCERFDVVVPQDGSARVALFEVYKDEAAFKQHQASDHYRAFVQARGDMIKSVRFGAFKFVEADLA